MSFYEDFAILTMDDQKEVNTKLTNIPNQYLIIEWEGGF